VALELERVRADEEPLAERFAAPGGGAAGRQIGQFSMKRLWRQKLGGTSPSLGRPRTATFLGGVALQRPWRFVPGSCS
jgi:hypothetical protein